MAAEQTFSWPYPKTPRDLVHICMITLVLLLIGLIATGFRYQAYQHLTLDRGSLQQSAESLDNTATAAVLLLKQKRSGEVTNMYFQAYADQLASDAESTAGYIAARQAEPNLQDTAKQLADAGQQLQTVLQPLAQPSDTQTIKQALAEVTDLEQAIKQTESDL